MAEESADGKLRKLTIEAYKDKGYSEKKDAPNVFTAMFNPTTFNRKLDIEYEDGKAVGNSGAEKKFKGIKPGGFDIEFLIDGTGASGEKVVVQDKINEFIDVCAKYYGAIHRPPYLIVKYGKIELKSVLLSMAVSYTMFNKDGTPIRAKISASFAETLTDDYRVKTEKNSSPDLTHVRTVLEGDTLPLMSKRIYGDSKYYIQVAKVNSLTNYRNLTPGAQLFFPPIAKIAK